MPFIIKKGDITKIEVDAIVNAAGRDLMPGGGVCGAIHDAAGPELCEECRKLRPPEPGRAVITRGYRLPAGHVIHTVGPVWRGGASGESEGLYSCYRESLALAREHGLASVAFPLISSGFFGYPPDLAYDVAQRAITDFLRGCDMTVYMILRGNPFRGRYDAIRKSLWESPVRPVLKEKRPSKKNTRRASVLYDTLDLAGGITEDAVLAKPPLPPEETEPPAGLACASFAAANAFGASFNAESFAAAANKKDAEDREIILTGLEDGFSETLLKMIDQKGLSDPECYRRANIDRKLFSKIRSTPDYHPRKDTVLAFCIALELDEGNAEKLLGSAGYTLSRALKKDAVIRYFISRGQFDIYEINNALYDFDQTPLGSF